MPGFTMPLRFTNIADAESLVQKGEWVEVDDAPAAVPAKFDRAGIVSELVRILGKAGAE